MKYATTTAEHFPTAQVEKITGVKPNDWRYRWDGGTLADLRKLVKIGAADPNDRQNFSPTIRQFLEGLKLLDARKVRLLGYVAYPPRHDARVSVDGFTARGLTALQANTLMTKYAGASEKEKKPIGIGKTFSVRFWWD